MSLSNELIIQHTQNWLRSFIVKFSICPFARRELERNSLRIQVSLTQKLQQAAYDLLDEIQLLDKSPEIETTLLVFPQTFRDFFQYLDFIEFAELLLAEQGYEGVYQLASFHPDYCFAEADFDDVANFSNRSPYPMVHLLREESVEKAIAYYGDTSQIPEQNILHLRELGAEAMQKILAGCIPTDKN